MPPKLNTFTRPPEHIPSRALNPRLPPSVPHPLTVHGEPARSLRRAESNHIPASPENLPIEPRTEHMP